MNTVALILLIISGCAWTIVYIDSIRMGFRDKTYCMPLWALGLNICWEIIYSFDGFSHPSVQLIANTVWALCDILIVVTYFRYGKSKLPGRLKSVFLPYSLLAFFTCLMIQLAFYLHFPDSIEAAQYSAFLQNVAMSVLFVVMLCQRGTSDGQSMLIAVAKWVGTLAPTLQQGLVQNFNIYILIMGALCSVWDLLYIFLLRRKFAEEKQG
ncbi:MAG: hypothetical protein IJ229_01135 [Clostridia bacterium]|nr:hypothetical protein [Clostridia bacterium]MBR1684695.1 hypothetical protein [Clostridia bacterium]MBR2288545.1 hypothetical protein [Clostridia bacterium]